jgi:hypothetical protein
MNLPDYTILQTITDLDLQATDLAKAIQERQASLESVKVHYEEVLKEDEVLIKDRITIKIKRKAIADHITDLKSKEKILKSQIQKKLQSVFGKEDTPKKQKASKTISKSIYTNY